MELAKAYSGFAANIHGIISNNNSGSNTPTPGAAGGFGGGGGGGGGNGGNGGFGGGGGAGGIGGAYYQFNGGNGGFGGGGGGGGAYGLGGKGGFGAGNAGAGAFYNETTKSWNAGYGGGGGGLGAGGAIFVQQGGTLNFTGSGSITGATAAGGTAAIGGQNGSGFGAGIFLQGNETLHLTPGTGQTISIGNIADESGSQAGYSTQVGGLAISGGGTVVIGGDNTYTGVTVVDSSTLDIAAGATFDSTVEVKNNGIVNFGDNSIINGNIDLSGFGSAGGNLTLSFGTNVTFNGAFVNFANGVQFPGAIYLTNPLANDVVEVNGVVGDLTYDPTTQYWRIGGNILQQSYFSARSQSDLQKIFFAMQTQAYTNEAYQLRIDPDVTIAAGDFDLPTLVGDPFEIAAQNGAIAVGTITLHPVQRVDYGGGQYGPYSTSTAIGVVNGDQFTIASDIGEAGGASALMIPAQADGVRTAYGILDLTGNNTFTGGVYIGSNGALELGSTTAAGAGAINFQDVRYATGVPDPITGGGNSDAQYANLLIDTIGVIANPILHYNSSDIIDIVNPTVTGHLVADANGYLTIAVTGGTVSINLGAIGGAYGAYDLESDGHGGALLTPLASHFTAGTVQALNAALASISTGGANATPGAHDTIALTAAIALGGSASVNLPAGAMLDISGSPLSVASGTGLTIKGSGDVIFDGLTYTATGNATLFDVQAGANATVTGATLTGGGIKVEGTLTFLSGEESATIHDAAGSLIAAPTGSSTVTLDGGADLLTASPTAGGTVIVNGNDTTINATPTDGHIAIHGASTALNILAAGASTVSVTGASTNVTATTNSGSTVTITGNIAGMLTVGNAAIFSGGGKVELGGTQTLSGGITLLNDTVLELDAGISLGTRGNIVFADTAGAVLQIDGTVMPTNQIGIPSGNGTIDLRGLAPSGNQVLTVTGNGTLNIPYAGGSASLSFSSSKTGTKFEETSDGQGGTEIFLLHQTSTITSEAQLDAALGVPATLPNIAGVTDSILLTPGIGAITLTGDLNTVSIPSHVGFSIADAAGTGAPTQLVLAANHGAVLDGQNSFAGGVAISAGSTLELKNAQAAGTGAITFAGAGGTLILDSGIGPANTISGFVPGDKIVLKGISAAVTQASEDIYGNLAVGLTGGGTLNLAIAGIAANTGFTVAADGSGNTVISVNYAQQDVTVSTEAQLDAAIAQANAMTGNGRSLTIHLAANIALTADMAAITLNGGTALNIDGGGFTIDGGALHRGVFVYSGAVTLQNLTVANMLAQGGNGGNGVAGGGGAGLGGGLFVAAAVNVTLLNTGFSGGRAVGGNGGAFVSSLVGAGAGGGGMGGNGGNGGANMAGGGGGFGPGANGGSGAPGSSASDGGVGELAGLASGGNYSNRYFSPGGRSGGGGGGGGYAGGGGGVGGGSNSYYYSHANSGGFGGGGGGGFEAGNGGFGGGGGGGFSGGVGGFGGGGGSGAYPTHGGFGGGNGAGGYGGGGGGLGAGGNIFVQQGGVLTIAGGVSDSGGSAQGGSGVNNGQALGGGIFAQGIQTIALAPAAGTSISITDDIADEGGIDGGTLSLIKSGAGSVSFSGVLSYSGTTVIQTGSVSFSGDTSQLHGALTIDAGATLALSQAGVGVAGAILDLGALTLAGAVGSQPALSGAVSGSGTVSVTGAAGSAATDMGAALWTGGTNIASGVSLWLDGDTSSLSGGIADAGTLVFGQSANSSLSTAISGAGSVVEAGSGMLTLGTANSYSGGTIIRSGTLALAALGAAGSGEIRFAPGSASALALNLSALTAQGAGKYALAQTIGGFSFGNLIDLQGVGFDASATLGAGNVLTVSGGGKTVALQLDPADSFTAPHFVTTDDGNGGTLLRLYPQLYSFTAGGQAGFLSDISSINVGGANSATNQIYSIALGSYSFGSAAINLATNDSLTLDGTGSTDYGKLSVTAGLATFNNLSANSNFTLTAGPAANVTFGSGDSLTGSSPTSTLLMLQGTQTVRFAPGAGQSDLVSGVIADERGTGTGMGVGSLELNGPGTLTLIGNNNFTGGIALDQGTLYLQSAGAAGTGPIRFSAGASATLKLSDSTTKPAQPLLGFAQGDTLDLVGFSLRAGNASIGPGNLLSLNGYWGTGGNGTVSFALDPSLSYGNDFVSVLVSGNDTLISLRQKSYTVSTEAQLNAALATIDTSGAVASSYTITLAADFTGANAVAGNLNPIKLASGVSLVIDGAGHTMDGGGTARGFLIQSGSVTIQNLAVTNMVSQDGAGGGLVAGQGANVTLANTNISSGSGSGGTGSGLLIQGTQALTFAPGAGITETISDAIADQAGSSTGSGVGSLVKTGAGTLTLSAGNNFTGGITITQGTVELAAPGSAGSGVVTVSGSGVLKVNPGAFAGMVQGIALGSGAVDFAGVSPGALNISSVNGNTVVNGVTIAGVTSVSAIADGAGGTRIFVPQTSFNYVNSESALDAALAAISIGGQYAAINTSYSISMGAWISLSHALPAINLASGSSLTLTGNGGAYVFGEGNAGFDVQSGTVTLEYLGLTNFAAGVGVKVENGANVTLLGADTGYLSLAAQADFPGFDNGKADIAVAAGGTLSLQYDSLFAAAGAPVSNLILSGAVTQSSSTGQVREIAYSIVDGASAGSLVLGAGTTVLEAAGTYSGGTSVTDTLVLAATGAAGSGAITLGSSAILEVDSGVSVANTIVGFGGGAAIDAVGIANGTASLSGHILTITNGSQSVALTLASPPSGPSLMFSSDGHGGTLISVAPRTLATDTHAGSVHLGAVHVGATVSGTLVVNNTATTGDAIIGNFVSVDAPFAASGSLSVTPGTSGTLGLSLSPISEGAYSGNAVLALDSHSAGRPDILIDSRTVAVSGKAYGYAAPQLSTAALSFGAVRVGGTDTQSLTIADGSGADPYQESLVYLAAAAGGFTVVQNGSGTVASGSHATIGLSLSTAQAGLFSSSAAFTLTSTGAGTSGLADTSLSGQSVTLSGKVYAAAVAQIATSVNFGYVHVGDTASFALAVGNGASGALTDVLNGSFGTVSGKFSGSGSVSSIAAGSSGTLNLSMVTTAAGVFNGTAALNLASHDFDLSDLALNQTAVSLAGIVDNYASALIKDLSSVGTLSGSGNSYTLHMGTILSPETVVLGIKNSATGQADTLGGTFQISGSAAFSNSGFSSFSGVTAGSTQGGFQVMLGLAQGGSLSETIVYTPVGSNAGGYSGALAPITITVQGTVPTTDYTVSDQASLNQAIDDISQGGGLAEANTAYTITLAPTSGSTLALTGALDAINLMSGSSLVLIGGGNTMSGGGVTVIGGAVTLNNLSITQATTGLSVASGASAVARNVNFTGDGTDIAAQQGASVTDQAGTMAAGSSSSAITLANSDVMNFTPQGGDIVTVNGVISGSGGVKIGGAGKVVFAVADSYGGGTDVAGSLELKTNGAAGSGAIMLENGAVLKVDSGVSVANSIAGFGAGTTIDAAGIAGATATLTPTSLVISNGARSLTLTMNTLALSPYGLVVSSDGNGGTSVTYASSAPPEVLASPSYVTSINLGNFHVGAIAGTNISIGNLVLTGGDTLLGGFGMLSSGLTGSGALNVAPGSTGSLGVSLSTAQDGAFSGTAALKLLSQDTYFPYQAATALASAGISISAGIYALANPVLPTTVSLGVGRVGTALAGTIAIADGSAADPYQESLAYVASVASPLHLTANASGTVMAGSSAQIGVSLGANNDGTISKTVNIALTSTGAGTSGLANTRLTTQHVTVTGTYYDTAIASTASSLNFGIVHVGDTVSQALSVANTATGALVDSLIGGFGAVTAPFLGSGSISVAGGSSQNLTVSLNTAASGSFVGTAGLALASHDAAQADAALSISAVALTGQVNNYAQMALGFANSSELTGSGTSYTLNLGSLSGGAAFQFSILNAATGLADALGGSIEVISGSPDFGNSGLGAFSGLTAGQADTAPTINFNPVLGGAVSETIVIHGAGSNASGYSGALPDITLTVNATAMQGSDTHATPITDEAGLNAAIAAFDVGGGEAAANTNYVINLAHGAIALTSALDAINLMAGSTLTIIGNGASLNGGGSQRGFFDYQGGLTLENLVLTDMVAQGGNGGDAYGQQTAEAGGGGAGLGGGLFVADGGAATLQNVQFIGDSAIGGNGGRWLGVGTGSNYTGGGGGMGGDGGEPNYHYAAGGGGIGTGANGIYPGSNGAGAGIVTGAGNFGGGGGADKASQLVFGGLYGLGGGIGAAGSNGGFGGGGGGLGGNGGFGGGGGGGNTGGSGGFGGGGGGGGQANGFFRGSYYGRSGGSGGFGAGSGYSFRAANGGYNPQYGGGGGGLGAGADVFVQQGGQINIVGA